MDGFRAFMYQGEKRFPLPYPEIHVYRLDRWRMMQDACISFDLTRTFFFYFI